VTDDSLAHTLNRHCHCINVDHDVLQELLEARLGMAGAWARLQQSHPNLLADSPVFISHGQVRQVTELIGAIERVVSLDTFQDRVLDWAPPIARHNPGAHGVFFGYDFHLTNDGPQLIEINTNAGGALLLQQVASAQQACCDEVENFVTGRVDTADLEHAFVEMFRNELQTQLPGRELRRVAVVDERPAEQYLSPEFTLFARMFEHHDIDAIVAGPEAFALHDRQLHVDDQPVDLVYNRLTDFYLQSSACAVLNRAYQDAAVVITPSPYTHAVYANKRNMTVLCDPDRLTELGVDAATIATLLRSVPRTELVTTENADALWSRRKQLFFKPACGYGSRGTYKGAKLTRKTWEGIVGADYIAQQLVAPSERLIVRDGNEQALKLDVRCYTYKGEIQLLGARMYRGQTTNFRTDGGGLAAVFIAPGG
jgi:glutathione synthase/RimK-type ligase-like ATP-grasp enzyme